MRYRGLLILVLGLMLSDGASLAQVVCRTLPVEVTGGQFGYSVAASGSTTAYGANRGNRVVVRDGSGVTTLSEGTSEDQFGFATSLDGDWLVVGAPTADVPGGKDAGAVYVFLRDENGWALKQTLTGNGSAGSQFGFTVALHGNTLAVGAAMDDEGGTFSGAVYVFEWSGSNWVFQKKFPGARPFDGLGSAIAAGDKIVAAGAPFVDGPAGGNQGAVHVFTKVSGNWTESSQVLMASEAKAGDQFGYAVSIEGSTLAVGARRGDERGVVDAGWVALFQLESGTWSQRRRFTAGEVQPGALFGNAVALSGDRLLVGAFLADGGHGAAYLFESTRAGTVPKRVAVAPAIDLGRQERFGFAVALSGETVAIGAFMANGGAGFGCKVEPDLRLMIDNVSQAEGNSGAQTFVFTVKLVTPDGTVTPAGPGGVSFDIATAPGTASDTGVADRDDYAPMPVTRQSIAAGNSTYTFNVRVKGDTLPEPDETFFVEVTKVAGNTVKAVGTIKNDDFPNLTINDVSQAEGNSGATGFTFTVSLSAPAGAPGVTFDVAADRRAPAPGIATAGTDFVRRPPATLKIPVGNSTATFTVPVRGDTSSEPNEVFFVNVTKVTGAISIDSEGVGTIQDDEGLPSLRIGNVSLNEGNSGTKVFRFTISLSSPAGPGEVSFNVATVPGTAGENSDYVAKSLTGQTIPAGGSTYTFDVRVNGDTAAEPDETFFVDVTRVGGGLVVRGVGTIMNDDVIPVVPNLTINDVSQYEGSSLTTSFPFTVRLSSPAGPDGVRFNIATAPGTAVAPSDYANQSLTGQTIPAGSSTYTFTVLVVGDTARASDETFFVNVTNVEGAAVTDSQGLGTIRNDDLAIYDVQGSGATTPIPPDIPVAIQGIVTANFQGEERLRGFFLQEEVGDGDPLTSDGIFVFCDTCPAPVSEGQRVGATGLVSELTGMTRITASTAGSVAVLAAGNHPALVPPTPIDLPVAGDLNAFYEAREGMLVSFVDTLTVSGHSGLARFGQIELFEGSRPRQFTEREAPSQGGYVAHLENLARRRVIVDDDDDALSAPLALPEGLQYVFHPRSRGGFSTGAQGIDFFRGGDQVPNLRGVLHWSSAGVAGTEAWRIRPTAATPVTFTVANPRPAGPPNVGGAIKAANVDLQNYFTTIDTTADSSGSCGPAFDQECRGADSAAELDRQRERVSIVICGLDADVITLMELENTTPTGTIDDLLGAVNARCGVVDPYASANTGILGTDAIRVAMIYRSVTLSPVGPPLFDLDSIHERPPIAQTFDVSDQTNVAFNERFTVVANHFTAKDCDAAATGADADSGDGQGCYAGRRTSQAARMLTWINGTVVPAASDPDVLLLGIFNSFARETPMTTLTVGGLSSRVSPDEYSSLFDGQLAHLDYAFGNASLIPQVTATGIWHINADESDLFDYNDDVKDDGEEASEEKPNGSALVPPRTLFQPASSFRASAHDPMLVGLFQRSFHGDKLVTGQFYPGGSVTYTVILTNASSQAQGDNAGNEFSDVLPATLALVSAAASSGVVTPTLATNTVTWNGSLAPGASVTISFNATISVGVAVGMVITNQGTIFYDADGNGSNEAAALTDDPDSAGIADPTSFEVEAEPAPVPIAAQGTVRSLQEEGDALPGMIFGPDGE